MEFKKAIAGGLAALAAGATLALGAAAATCPVSTSGLGQLVCIDGNTMTSPYIVIGSNAAAEDTLAGADLGVALGGVATRDAEIAGVTQVSATGGVMVTSDLNKTYLGEAFNKVKTSLTRTELPDTLKTLEFTDINATIINYAQRVDLGTASATYNKPTGEVVPVLNVPLTTATTPFNMTVNFIGGLDSEAFDTSYEITLFGKSFTFGPSHSNSTLQLYSKAGASTVSLSGVGDEETVTIGTTPYTFKLVAWSGANGVALNINDVATSPSVWSQGGTYTIPGTTTKVYVNSVSVLSLDAQSQTVLCELFVGTDKLTLTHGGAITKNDESTNSVAYFDSTTAPKINALTVEVFPQEDTVVTDSVSFADPIFGAVKLSLKDMTPGMTSSARDLIKITSGSNQVRMTFTNKDGNEYTEIPISYANSTAIYRLKDASYKFMTQECNGTKNLRSLQKGDYFLVTSGDYSYLLKYDNNYLGTDATKDYVTLKDLSTNTLYKVYIGTSDNYMRVGSLSFLVEWDSGTRTGKKICVDLDGSGTFASSSVNLKTQSGQIVTIPQDVPDAINITETPLYTVSDSNDPTGGQIDITAAYSTSGGMTYTATNAVTLEQHGSEYEWSDVTTYGTYAHATGDTNGKKTVELFVPGQRPGFVNLAIGNDPVISSSATAAGVVREAVQIKNSISKMETEISTASLDRDLILVGGPCANGLVATLLDMSASKPQCVSDFTALYPTEGVIKIVSNAFSSGQKALVVAGVDRTATRNLAEKVMQGTLSYSA